jgi:hypothetical protein
VPSIIHLPPRAAQYCCLGCGSRFEGWAGPTECPACSHVYVKWLDYEGGANVENPGSSPRPGRLPRVAH